MSKIFVADTNILMDYLICIKLKNEQRYYRQLYNDLIALKIDPKYMNESLKSELLVFKSTKRRNDKVSSLRQSIDKIITENDAKLVITPTVEFEFRKNLTLDNNSLEIDKNKIKNDDSGYINKIVSRLKFYRYAPLIEQELSKYDILSDPPEDFQINKVKKFGRDGKIYRCCQYHSVDGIVTNNVKHFQDLNTACCPPFNKIKIYVPNLKDGTYSLTESKANKLINYIHNQLLDYYL